MESILFSCSDYPAYAPQKIQIMKCIQIIMSTNSVYSIRIDSRVRKIIDELDDPSWQDEVRAFIERLAREKRKAQLLERARKLHKEMEEGVPAAGIIREDRDAR